MRNFHVSENEDYIRIFEKCPYRNGWICVLQVPRKDWRNPKYDKYRKIYKISW